MTKTGALRNSSINWILFSRLVIQNHSKLSNTEKRRNRRRPACQNLSKALDISGATARVASHTGVKITADCWQKLTEETG